jgi:hypothetical protein
VASVKLAVFITKTGVDRVVPAGGAGLEETEAALKLYRLLSNEIARFDDAIRRKTAAPEKPRKLLVETGVN